MLFFPLLLPNKQPNVKLQPALSFFFFNTSAFVQIKIIQISVKMTVIMRVVSVFSSDVLQETLACLCCKFHFLCCLCLQVWCV